MGLRLWRGETEFNYTGPQPPCLERDTNGGRAARPCAGALRHGTRADAGADRHLLGRLNAPLTAVFSTLGRTAARGIETKVFADALRLFHDQLIEEIQTGNTVTFNGERWEPRKWPAHAEGFGFIEARGALGHWVVIDRGKIQNCQMVVPTTWNGPPRDHNDQPGAYEASLEGHTLARPEWPLEILRTVHSFDPYMACAIHLVDATGEEIGNAHFGLRVSKA